MHARRMGLPTSGVHPVLAGRWNLESRPAKPTAYKSSANRPIIGFAALDD